MAATGSIQTGSTPAAASACGDQQQARHDAARRPDIGAQVPAIRLQGDRVGVAAHHEEPLRDEVVGQRRHQHDRDPESHVLERLSREQLVHGLADDQRPGDEDQEGLDGAGDVLDLAVAEGVLFIGRLTRGLDGSQGDDGSGEVDSGVIASETTDTEPMTTPTASLPSVRVVFEATDSQATRLLRRCVSMSRGSRREKDGVLDSVHPDVIEVTRASCQEPVLSAHPGRLEAGVKRSRHGRRVGRVGRFGRRRLGLRCLGRRRLRLAVPADSGRGTGVATAPPPAVRLCCSW